MATGSTTLPWWRNWGLTVTLLGIFVLVWLGQSVTGWSVYNSDAEEHGKAQVSYAEYMASSHFWEATTENWESEFLQMLAFVLLTVVLRQKGSPESDEPEEPLGSGRPPQKVQPPWPVRKGGAWRRVYEHSLSLALAALFLGSWIGHLLSSVAEHNDEQLEHGAQPVTATRYLAEPQLWFESFQNWQSEFMSTGLLVILTVYLREKGSSQSKAVEESQESTGAE